MLHNDTRRAPVDAPGNKKKAGARGGGGAVASLGRGPPSAEARAVGERDDTF